MGRKSERARGTKKAGRKDVLNLSISVPKQKVSCNWLSFIKSDIKLLKRTMKTSDSKSDCSFKRLKSSRNVSEPLVTKVLSLDCEMVSDIDDKNMLGRVSIVNYKLQCIYDKYVKPTSPVGDYRTRFSGIRESDLENGGEFEVVQHEVKCILQNKILVGHALGNDFKVLKFGHHKKLIRDTSKYEPFRQISEGKSPSLKKLARSLLGENIQDGEHSSIEDAKTAMKLYIKYRHEWEASLLNSNGKHHATYEYNEVLNVL